MLEPTQKSAPNPYAETFANASMEFTTVEERNTWLDAAIDPGHTLPAVTLISEERTLPGAGGSPYMHNDITVMNDQGETTTIGYCGTPVDAGTEEHPWPLSIDNVKIYDKDYLGQGYGMATYLALMKKLPLGVGMRAAYTLSAHSYKIWRTLEEKGVVVSNMPDEQVDHVEIEVGDYPSGVEFRTIFGEHDKQKIGQTQFEKSMAEEERRVQQYLDERARIKKEQSLMYRILGKLGIGK